MYYTPISSAVNVSGIREIERPEHHFKKEEINEEVSFKQPTFMDVFSNIYGEAVQTNRQKSQDMLDIMLGDVDDIAQIQLNLQKAEFATELFITVKNTIHDAYNEIIKMNV